MFNNEVMKPEIDYTEFGENDGEFLDFSGCGRFIAWIVAIALTAGLLFYAA